MSHFTVLVIGDGIEEQLAPYDENMEVEEYEIDCSCVGRQAAMYAREETPKRYGKSIDELRDEYWEMEEGDRPEWEEHIKGYVDLEQSIEELHPHYGEPDPGCSECGGTGKTTSKYNPESKWDWYSVGGRWGGFFRSKPKEDCKYPEMQDLGCPGVFDNDPTYDCDSIAVCDIDWEQMTADEVLRLSDVYDKAMKEDEKLRGIFYDIKNGETKEQYIDRRTKHIIMTYAIVKDGEWYQRGEMGWFGTSSNEMDEDEWADKSMELIKGLPEDTRLTVVDCHI